MSDLYQKLETCLASVRKRTDFKPEVALILGSGLGDYADEIQIETTIEYTEIEGFPTSTVAGHKGRFVFGYVKNVPIVIMQGRVHYYEGYPMTDVVLPTRLMGMMGAKKLFLTNAAGGVNPNFKPGDFMMITDHITTCSAHSNCVTAPYSRHSHFSRSFIGGTCKLHVYALLESYTAFFRTGTDHLSQTSAVYLHSCRPQRQICIWICEKCADCDHAGKSALL